MAAQAGGINKEKAVWGNGGELLGRVHRITPDPDRGIRHEPQPPDAGWVPAFAIDWALE